MSGFTTPPPWRLPPWWRDVENLNAKVALPEAGGWIYRFRDQFTGLTSQVFVPDMTAWANAIANAIAAPKTAPVAVHLNLAAVTHVKQPVPGNPTS